ncbi:MAG: peroxide stress protein YaaA [Flavobacteriales bacterium]
MICLLSPAKNLNENPIQLNVEPSLPLFNTQAKQLVQILKKMKPKELAEFMNLSENLAELNATRFKNWSKEPKTEQAKAAAFLFNGDTYQGLDFESLNTDSQLYAQKSLRILSGLYGCLRPFDLVQPYRLEMGKALETKKGKNLYQFWDNTATKQINKDIKALDADIVLICASKEYAKVVDYKALKAEVWTPIFKDFKTDKYKIISFFAKKARGLMARFVIENQVKTLKEVQAFSSEGYYFHAIDEKKKELIFHRD